MKKQEKLEITQRIRENLENAQALYIVDYSGISVKALEEIRWQIKALGNSFNVIKNTLVAKAIKSSKWSAITNLLEGPNAFAICYNDPISLAKLLLTIEKAVGKFKLKSAMIETSVFNHDQIEAISKLPPKEVLLARMLGSMNAPITNFVTVLSAILKKPLYALNAIKEIKESK